MYNKKNTGMVSVLQKLPEVGLFIKKRGLFDSLIYFGFYGD